MNLPIDFIANIGHLKDSRCRITPRHVSNGKMKHRGCSAAYPRGGGKTARCLELCIWPPSVAVKQVNKQDRRSSE